MKKLYFSLLLTTSSLLCMEKQQAYQYNNPQRVIIPEYALATSYQSNMQQYSQPGCCEANEPGWEFYDDIANASYNSHPSFTVQSFPMTAIPQKPVYKPASTNVTQREKVWLLNSNSPEAIELIITQKDKEWLLATHFPQPDKAITQTITIMQDLYDQASNIIFDAQYGNGTQRPAQQRENEQFIQIIRNMNNAKKKGINEDLMGEFAYKNPNSLKSSLFFILLKKYNVTVQKTGEKQPSFLNQKHLCLKEILNTSTNTKTVATHPTDTRDIITKYPTFFQLIYTVNDALKGQLSESSIKTFATYLYENNNILLEDYSDGSYKNFKNEFYAKAYDMFQAFLLESGVNCYILVQMIDKAKEVGDINNEDDLIEHMAHYTAPQSLGTTIKNLFDSSHTDTERKRIVLFCKLVKIYNNKRGFKITPTMNQYHAYCTKKTLRISLPEHLSNRDLFDKNSYAFDEIAELKDATNELKKLNANEIKELL